MAMVIVGVCMAMIVVRMRVPVRMIVMPMRRRHRRTQRRCRSLLLTSIVAGTQPWWAIEELLVFRRGAVQGR